VTNTASAHGDNDPIAGPKGRHSARPFLCGETVCGIARPFSDSRAPLTRSSALHRLRLATPRPFHTTFALSEVT
jgi:hypothetical protein